MLERLIPAATLVAMFAVPCIAQAETNVGAMQRVYQTVYGTPPYGQPLAKHAGDGVVFQETIQTWTGSSAVVRFIDGSQLTVGAKSNVLIDEFVFDPKKHAGNALIKISAGGLHFVTGGMPKGQTVIKTPTATLTLRGTDVSVYVHPDGTTDVSVQEGIVRNHNDKTGADTTMGAGDQQTSDQSGNHDNQGDPANDYIGGDPGGSTSSRNGSSDLNTTNAPVSERHDAPQSERPQTGND
jgi:hypothetical protein